MTEHTRLQQPTQLQIFTKASTIQAETVQNTGEVVIMMFMIKTRS